MKKEKVQGKSKNRDLVLRFALSFCLLHFYFFLSSPSPVNAAEDKTIEELRKQIDARSQEIQRLQEEAKRFRTLVNQKAQEQKNLGNRIALLAAEINELTVQIRITETGIRRTQAAIGQLTADIDAKEAQIERAREELAGIIQAIDEISYEPPLATLLRAASLSVFTDEIEQIADLNQSLQERLGTLQILKQQLQEDRRASEEKKGDLEASKRNLTVRENVTEERKDEHQRLLNLTGKAKQEYETALKETERRQREIQEEIIGLETKLQRLLDPTQLPAARPGLLAWPTGGSVSQGYGPTSETGFINDAYKFHNGIDVAVAAGTPIKAAAEGVVKAVGDNGKYAYGKWVAIDHENGLTTMYAHLSRPAVSPGKKISRGEVIGYSGSTGFSTGPHLHLTVYATHTFRTEDRWFGLLPLGASVNPLQYL